MNTDILGKRDVFLVASPLQALNAIEACYAFGIKPADSVLISFDSALEANDRQLRRMLMEESWSELHVIPYHGPNLAAWFGRMRKLDSIAKSLPRCRHLFLGDYGFDLVRHFTTKVGPAKVILLDDGGATVELMASRKDPSRPKYFYGPPYTSPCKLRLKRALGMRDALLPVVTYFTVYDLAPEPGSSLVLNSYAHLRASAPADVDRNALYFLGTPGFDMPEDAYFDLVSRALRHLGDIPKRYYLPHRREPDGRIERLRNDLGLTCLRFDAPIEYGICRLSDSVPHLVAGFPSTAFNTLETIFGDKVTFKVFHLEPPDSAPYRKMVAEYQAYYRRYRAPAFEVVLDY